MQNVSCKIGAWRVVPIVNVGADAYIGPYSSFNLQFIALLREDDNVTFLCPHKKVTKESGWGMC